MSTGQGQHIQAVLLAGTHPWAKASFDSDLPRPLVPVAHWPLICYSLQWLHHAGIEQATICANSASRAVRRCLADGSSVGLQLSYYEDRTPRGPAGCARDASIGSDADAFVVVDATIVPQVDLTDLLSTHRRSGAAVTVVVHPDHAGPVPGEHLTPSGIYVFSAEALAEVNATGYQDIKEVLIPRLHLSSKHVETYRTDQICPRIADAATYLAVNEWMMERVGADPSRFVGYRRVDESYVHVHADVSSSARLVGPVLIGPGTRIGAEVTVVGPTSIGAACRIDDRAVLCRSILWDGCAIGKAAAVDGCILTNQGVVQPSAKLYGHVVRTCPTGGAYRRVRRLLWRLGVIPAPSSRIEVIGAHRPGPSGSLSDGGLMTSTS